MSGSLDHSPAKITLDLMVLEGLAQRVDPVAPVDWMGFVNKGQVEKGPIAFDFHVDKIITVYDTVGIVNSRYHYNGVYHESHGLQILLRLNEYDEAIGYSKAKSIQDHLDTQILRYDLTVGSTNYRVHSYNRTTDVIRLNTTMRDDTVKGLRFALNLLMFVTKV